jgi:hypothetical protein
MEAVEQASAENLLGGVVIVGGHVSFDILLPVFGLRTTLCVNTLAERMMSKRKGPIESILTAVGKVARSFS